MIPGLGVDIGPEAVWVRAIQPLRVASSAMVGGGLGARAVRRAVSEGTKRA